MMDTILQGIQHVIYYLDDILITGSTESEHNNNLEEVLCQLEEHEMCCRMDKCEFFQSSVEYLGHYNNAEGVHTAKSKVTAIYETPASKNVQELRSFLGLLNYYAKYILNLASLLYSLHSLLKNGQPWRWTQVCEDVFKRPRSNYQLHQFWSIMALHFNSV